LARNCLTIRDGHMTGYFGMAGRKLLETWACPSPDQQKINTQLLQSQEPRKHYS